MMFGSAADQFFFFFEFGFPISPKVDPTTVHLISAAASFNLLRLSLKRLSHLDHVHRLKKLVGNAFQIEETNFRKLSNGAFGNSYSACYCLFNGGEMGNDHGNKRLSRSGTSPNLFSNKRQWTNVLLAINAVTYIAQVATQGKLLLWGAKINSLIDQGQLWRLATSSFLHANIGHLMINCYSLNSVGPSMENISGPRRFLAVYMASSITSSVASYWFSKAPAVGASGAVFGLVGSLAVFVIRHRGLVKGGNEDLQRIAQVLILNMVIGLSTRGIDNWGHVGGLLGGAATSWLLGPAWKYESPSRGRRRVVDKAPIFYLINGKKQK